MARAAHSASEGVLEQLRAGDRLPRELRPLAPLLDGQGLSPRVGRSLRASTPQGSPVRMGSYGVGVDSPVGRAPAGNGTSQLLHSRKENEGSHHAIFTVVVVIQICLERYAQDDQLICRLKVIVYHVCHGFSLYAVLLGALSPRVDRAAREAMTCASRGCNSSKKS